jgi:hypothetical protein
LIIAVFIIVHRRCHRRRCRRRRLNTACGLFCIRLPYTVLLSRSYRYVRWSPLPLMPDFFVGDPKRLEQLFDLRERLGSFFGRR